MRFIRSSPLSPLFFFSFFLLFLSFSALLCSLSLSLKSTELRGFWRWVAVGEGSDLGFGGGSRWVGDPIWVLGVSAVGEGPNLGFGGFGGGSRWVGVSIWVLGVAATWVSGWGWWVDGYRLLPRFGYGCREREERDKWFFLSYLKKL